MNYQSSVSEFLQAYDRHDVEGMVDACAESATIRYFAADNARRQRIEYAQGFVRTVGKTWWTGAIDAVPDIRHRAKWIDADDQGNVVCEVEVGGKQAKHWNGITNVGGRFAATALFVFRVDLKGKIQRIAAYWDSLDLIQQLSVPENT